ncbi:MAG: prolyl oligopeptidase family serine peptidase [Pyrinomonadaceae bacterium]|nr:prolyl oligopeptidase family serine peptidase [Pyrinomonadaceae bacterium]
MIRTMTARLRHYRKRGISQLSQKNLGVELRLRQKMTLQAVIIALLTFSTMTCTRPLPPAGKNAPVIRGQQQDIYFYPAQGGTRIAQKVLFLCGDGGWKGRALDIAAGMSKAGYDVYGFDTKRYLETFTTDAGALKEEDVQRDLAQVAKWMQTRWRERISIVGWSEGAGLAVLAASAPDNEAVFDGVVVFGLSSTAILGWRLRDDVTYLSHRDPNEPMFRTNDYISKVAPLPLCLIQSSGDEFITREEAEGLFAAAQQPKLYREVPAQDHGFNGNSEGFFQALREGLAWVNQTAR